jgi:hypothetical protein
MSDMAVPEVSTPVLVGTVCGLPGREVAVLRKAIADVFVDWHIWVTDRGWHARRAGCFVQRHDGSSGVYFVGHPDPLAFVVLLDIQNGIRHPKYWPGHHAVTVSAAKLTRLDHALAAAPIDRARDVLAAMIEDRHPGWKIDHHLFGWTATSLADPERQLTSTSGPALEAIMPQAAIPADLDSA